MCTSELGGIEIGVLVDPDAVYALITPVRFRRNGYYEPNVYKGYMFSLYLPSQCFTLSLFMSIILLSQLGTHPEIPSPHSAPPRASGVEVQPSTGSSSYQPSLASWPTKY